MFVMGIELSFVKVKRNLKKYFPMPLLERYAKEWLTRPRLKGIVKYLWTFYNILLTGFLFCDRISIYGLFHINPL
jgi:hypothetical protein